MTTTITNTEQQLIAEIERTKKLCDLSEELHRRAVQRLIDYHKTTHQESHTNDRN